MNVIIDGEEKPLTSLIAEEQAACTANRGNADSREGMRAFLEKRKPVFNQP
jgi:enoyl-CoA hydratase/carnithine racemase